MEKGDRMKLLYTLLITAALTSCATNLPENKAGTTHKGKLALKTSQVQIHSDSGEIDEQRTVYDRDLEKPEESLIEQALITAVYITKVFNDNSGESIESPHEYQGDTEISVSEEQEALLPLLRPLHLAEERPLSDETVDSEDLPELPERYPRYAILGKKEDFFEEVMS